jgi:EAL domain-containing protein (putative c-di-GMP-specific phosphodiesterase class I)
VIENTFRWLVSEADERERLALCSINLSGASLADNEFLPFVIRQFQRSGLDASKICFEITETAAIASFAQASRFINALKELGCKFSLDDFGTACHRSLLKHFPVITEDRRQLRARHPHHPIDHGWCARSTIGHLTGKLVIAEFAENQDHQTLASLGVDYAQAMARSPVACRRRPFRADLQRQEAHRKIDRAHMLR